ncbi:MAG: CCA tRNA nucleotidyltransferase [Acidobacteria bacterium]|nr:CCA tRNA nucleotidyltransferase [Acidobacteriota bacterium]
MSLRDELLRLFPALKRVPAAGAYVVGGAVRDLLLGREPADVDVACPDPLAAAQAVRHKVIRLGREDHLNAWRVAAGDRIYDFAPIEGGDIDRDLARRDFTINAMAVALPSKTVLDPFDGRGDCERRLVRMVDAKNFDDDPLRMLKAIRMAVHLDFTIDPATLAAIVPRAEKVTNAAAERIEGELSAIFSASRFATALRLLRETQLEVPIFGRELPPFDREDVSLAGAYALLLDDPRSFAERWRFSEILLRDVLAMKHLIDRHDLVALYDAGERVAQQLPNALRALGRDADVAMPDFSIRPLLNGGEIAALTNLPPGPELGRIKRALLEAQVRGEVRTRDEAETFVSATA